MVEALLPPAVLAKASLRGREYAWPFADVPEAIAAAREAGLATLGAVAQFRIQAGTCELYWRCADAQDRRPGEPWDEYVARSADEVLAGVRRLPAAELVAEGLQWREVAALHAAGVDVSEYLCCVLDFDAPAAEPLSCPPNPKENTPPDGSLGTSDGVSLPDRDSNLEQISSGQDSRDCRKRE